MDITEDAARNELAAIRLFLKLSDDETVLGALRQMYPINRTFRPDYLCMCGHYSSRHYMGRGCSGETAEGLLCSCLRFNKA